MEGLAHPRHLAVEIVSQDGDRPTNDEASPTPKCSAWRTDPREGRAAMVCAVTT